MLSEWVVLEEVKVKVKGEKSFLKIFCCFDIFACIVSLNQTVS